MAIRRRRVTERLELILPGVLHVELEDVAGILREPRQFSYDPSSGGRTNDNFTHLLQVAHERDVLFHGSVGVMEVVGVAGYSHEATSLAVELHRSNRKLVAWNDASHTSATTPDVLDRDRAERRLDGDHLFRFGELLAAVDVDHVVVAVGKQHLEDVLSGHAEDDIPAGVRNRLPVHNPGADVAARIGAHERDQQTREPVRQHADAPELQRDAQARPLLVAELNGPARSDCVELLNDRVATGDRFKLLEQRVSLVPADFDDLSRDDNLRTVETVRHGRESTP